MKKLNSFQLNNAELQGVQSIDSTIAARSTENILSSGKPALRATLKQITSIDQIIFPHMEKFRRKKALNYLPNPFGICDPSDESSNVHI